MWSTENTLLLIEDFHTSYCLWGFTSADYKNRTKKRMTVEGITKKYGTSTSDVEKKIHNLKTQFYREHRKIKEIQKSGSSPFKSGWFAYDHLLSLLRGIEPRGSRNTDSEDLNESSETGNDPEKQS